MQAVCTVVCKSANTQVSKRNSDPNFLVRISSGGVGVFHVKGWGPNTFGMSFETQVHVTGRVWRDIPGYRWRDIPGVPEKFERKMCSIFGP